MASPNHPPIGVLLREWRGVRRMSQLDLALEAGLSWAVALDKGPFRGRDALLRQRQEGLPSRLRGLRMHERRHH